MRRRSSGGWLALAASASLGITADAHHVAAGRKMLVFAKY